LLFAANSMPTRITVKGQVTIPKRIRELLQLSPGEWVEFEVNTRGEILVRKAQELAARSARRRTRPVHPRVEAQMRRRAAELLALLRGLD
jgi:AbrB family looped-hinge helix DNA binding protein